MGTAQGDRQASVRAVTGTAYTYEGDFHALFDQAGIPAGDFNGRMLAWINATLGTSYADINGAMSAFAVAQGAASWNGMGTFSAVSFDVFADSLNGNDGNNGSSSAPVKTLSKAVSLLTGGKTKLGLAKGSVFRETLTVPASGLAFGAYGSGAKPVINGANLIQTAWTQTAASSGSVTRANMRLSTINGAAFVDFSAANVLTSQVGNLLTITDSAGKKITGYIKAAGTGETYGAELLPNTDFATTANVSVWYNTTLSSVAGGQSGNALKLTQAGGFGYAYQEFTTVSGALYKTSAYLQKGTETSQMQLGVMTTANANVAQTTGQLPATFTQSSVYFSAAATAYRQSYTNDTDGTYTLWDTASAKQVLTPSATGVTIVSTAGGTTQNWASQDAGFNMNDASGYTYSIGAASGNVWQTALATQPLILALNGVASSLANNPTSVAALNTQGQWFWGSNTLYIYSTSNPATAFASIEAAFRTNGVHLNGKDNVTVKGVAIQYANGEGITNGTANAGAGCVIDGCDMQWNAGAGISSSDLSSGWTIQNCALTYNGGKAVGLGSNDNVFLHGTGHTVQDNVSSNSFGDGLLIAGSGHVIRRNIVQNNGNANTGYGIELLSSTTDVYQNIVSGSAAAFSAIELIGGDGNKVHHNLVYANNGSGIALEAGVSEVTYNVIYGNVANDGYGINLAQNCDGSLIANNTCDGNLAGIRLASAMTSATKITNNLVTNNSQVGILVSSGGAATFANNNTWTNGNTGTGHYFGVTSQIGSNGNISADPLYANAAAKNYSLQAGSPCDGAGATIDAAHNQALAAGASWPAGVTLVTQAAAWDIGAYAR